jgi:aspartate carbamoyltransferase regulatory subunit
MTLALSQTPPGVMLRLRKSRGTFYVIARNGKGWKVIGQSKDRNKALEQIEKYHTNKDCQWSMDIKIRAHWRCEEENCWCRDRELPEAHHIESVYNNATRRHDLENGQCLCMFHHGMKHKGAVRDHIHARMGLILLSRLDPTNEEIKEAM